MSPRPLRSFLETVLAVWAMGWVVPSLAQVPIENLCPARTAAHHGSGNVSAWTSARADLPLARVTLNAANAVCNDGTPAIMYVRPSRLLSQSPDDPDAHRWIIHFKGGGGCDSYESCEDRWCSTPATQLNRAGLMSSRWAPDAIVGKGIFSSRGVNDFRDWNHVLLYYCSSDGWIGNQGPNLAQPYPAGAAAAPYTIQFRGAPITTAAFAALASSPGVAPDPGIVPDNADFQLPSLRDATTVIVSGDSAGANGVRHHIDRIADRLVRASTQRTPPVIMAVMDAGSAPQFSNPSLPVPAGMTYSSFMAQRASTSTMFHGVRTGALDQSCLAQTAELNFCYDTRNVMLNHITTPSFTRTDLFDPVGAKPFIQLISGGVPDDAQLDVATLTASDLGLLAAPGIEARQPISVFGPLCQSHIAIRSNQKFHNEQAVPNRMTFHDALSAWVRSCETGTCVPYQEIAADNGPNSNFFDPMSPVCP